MADASPAPPPRSARLASAVPWALALALVCCASFASVLQARNAEETTALAQAHRPLQVQSQKYVSSNACRSCHAREYESWASSYHRRMTQVATPQSVIPHFDGVKLGAAPTYALGSGDAGYYVDFEPQPDAREQRYPITLVTGSHHMQIYWYETGHDRNLGQLPFVYLNADQRWVRRNAIFLEPPTPMPRVAEGRWNASCIACHTTLGQPRIDRAGAFDTQVAEFGIACEACHGPGQEHIEHNRSPLARYRLHLAGRGDETIVQPKKLTHERASYVCGQCHGTWLYDGPASMRQWNEHGTSFRPGGDPPPSVWLLQPSRAEHDPRVASVMQQDPAYVAGLFWSDGVMRVSGREFNGMVDSPCYQRGELSCSSCHSLHRGTGDPRSLEDWRNDQLAAGMEGDRACLQCHKSLAQATEKHTHHAAGSEGSRCYNCHMTYTSYGLLKALRSHRIDVPSVTATLNAGRPNACNLCHLDRSLGWTARKLRELYGIASPALEADDENVALAVELGIKGDAGQRALIAWALGWSAAQAASRPAFAPALLGVLMDDPYDAVRYIAERSLRARGVDPSALHYDFLQRPGEREPVAPAVAELANPGLPPEERAQLQALFARLLPQRDDKPMRLLE